MAEVKRDIPRWRRIALPVSIVLNLFLVAVIAGHFLRHRGFEGGSRAPLARALARAEAVLPPGDAAAFSAVIRRGAPHYAEAAKQLAKAREELVRQITAEQFDPAATRRALAAWLAASDRFRSDFGDTFVDALTQVSPDGRQKIVGERRAERAASH